jgi:phospholipase C
MRNPISIRFAPVAVGIASALLIGATAWAQVVDRSNVTTTPIKHVIIVVGENHTFDNLFGTYKPKEGQHVDNLLSKGIVHPDGTPGRHFDHALQLIGTDTD